MLERRTAQSVRGFTAPFSPGSVIIKKPIPPVKPKAFRDPYQVVLDRFNRRGVAYVVVGMSGINYYAKDASEMFATLDYDLFLQPTLTNVEKALHCLEELGFGLGSRKGIVRRNELKRLVRERMTLTATTQEGIMVELLLRVSGYPLSELAKDAATFTVGRVPIRVGRLRKLLRSKQLANRPKDRQFLKRYQLLLRNSL